MISKYEDLNLLPEDTMTQIDAKLQDKLGICVYQLQQALEKPTVGTAVELAENFHCIAKFGDYSQMLEDTKSIAEFIKSDAYKSEHWVLNSIFQEEDNLIGFRFDNKAIDDGDSIKGFVFVSLSGKLTHAFPVSE